MTFRHRLRHLVRRWHRSIGATAALVVVLLVVTGIALNHASDLGLDRGPVASRWILDRYGIEIAPPRHGFEVDGRWLSACAGHLFLDDREVDRADVLAGAVALDGMIAVAVDGTVLLLTPEGERIERLDPAALPGETTSIGITEDGSVVIGTARGDYASDSGLLSWAAVSGASVETAQSRELPAALAQRIAGRARQLELSWERVLADVHSGRLLGRYGPLVVDGFAIGLLLLALSGFWMWLRSTSR